MGEGKNPLQKIGQKLKNGLNKRNKQSPKKIIKKVIKVITMIPLILKIIVILLLVITLLSVIGEVMDWIKGSDAKEVVGGAIEYQYVSYSGSQTEIEKNGYKIIPQIDQYVGGYKLAFAFFDENGKEVPEDEVLENIKNKLKENDIDFNKLTTTNLKIIAVLEKNGLKLGRYSQEELKCLPMFIKAEIATQNFDIRDSKDEIDLESILDNDLIYGTIDVTKTKVGSDGNEVSTPLQFLDYEEFKIIKEQNDISKANNYFSIDEEGNLVFAKWSKKTVEVSYKDKSGNNLGEEQLAQIPEENKVNPIEGDNRVDFLPIDYKENVNPYSLNFGLLSDLLITTQNPEFCMELCKLAFNSQVVIDFREETTIIDEYVDNTYNNTILLCDYAKYQVKGTHEVTGDSRRTAIIGGIGYPEDSIELRKEYGWKPNTSHTTNGNITTYTWSYKENDYELIFISDRKEFNSTWTLYEKKTNTSDESLPIIGNMSGNPELIIGGEEETFETKNYTDKEQNTYTVHVHTHTENNYYDYVVGKVDCWFSKFERKYKKATKETPISNSGPDTEAGTFKKISTNTYNSEDDINSIISKSDAVKEYIKNKEENYKNTYNDAENVICTIKEITQEIWEKEDVTYQSKTETIRDKFGDEEADTTDITFKNIVYNDNGSTFEKGTDIGFLSIYDEYIKNGEDLFLNQDAEKLLFKMLKEDSSTEVYSDLLKGLLYAYDGIDRGVTDLSSLLDVFKVKEFKKTKVKGSAVAEVLKSYEYEILREYRNGDKSKEQYLLDLNRIRFNENGELEYNLYELNANGDHSLNYSYGLRVYGFEDGKYGNESVFDEIFNTSGLIKSKVQEYFSTGNAWLNADLVDKVKMLIIENKKEEVDKDFKNYGIELTNNELEALAMISFGYGNCMPNADSVALLKRYKQGNATKDEVINGFYLKVRKGKSYPFKYKPWQTSGRANTIIEMFFEGRYILSTGEEIDPNSFFGEGILSYAKMIHDYMSDPAHLYYYCLNGSEKDRMVHVQDGGLPNCGLAPNFKQSQEPGQKGYRLACCATYVSWVLEEAGLIDQHSNSCKGLISILSSKHWIEIDNPSDVEPGDIVFYTYGHTNIYVGDGCCYDAGNYKTIQAVEPISWDISDRFKCAYRQP